MKPHRFELQIRFNDIDSAGHVNNAVYLSYFEQARLSYFDELLGVDHDWTAQGLLLAHAELDYHDLVKLNDKIHVEINCDRLGTKSFDLSYKIFKASPEGTVLCSSGKTIMVCYDFNKNVTIAIPEDWRRTIQV